MNEINVSGCATDFIERSHKDDTPFFLYLPHAMPHKPLSASEEFSTPETTGDLYVDVIREMDWPVGQIMKKLKQLEIDDNSFVIFSPAAEEEYTLRLL